jgi:hypothetical protein
VRQPCPAVLRRWSWSLRRGGRLLAAAGDCIVVAAGRARRVRVANVLNSFLITAVRGVAPVNRSSLAHLRLRVSVVMLHVMAQ